MAICDTCGNNYDKAFTVKIAGAEYVFDCFECAVHRLAPHCAQCDCEVIGHGVESEGTIYCSAHCASLAGVVGVRDRADTVAIMPT